MKPKVLLPLLLHPLSTHQPLIPLRYTPISLTLPQYTTSPTFQNILEQPTTLLFPSQSTEGPKPIHDDTTKCDDEVVLFVDMLSF